MIMSYVNKITRMIEEGSHIAKSSNNLSLQILITKRSQTVDQNLYLRTGLTQGGQYGMMSTQNHR